ncbi:MAG: hypothetical protein IPJ75_14645 [Ignavibacteriales bacterium]|nr:hypothetical protein [Ignavibacteriales bacterium]
MRNSRFTFLFLFLFLPSLVAGQGTRRIEQISIAEGLSAATVLSIIQDAEGYLWVGTILGLNRYDGKKFTSFFHDAADNQSLSGNTVSCMTIGLKGELWIGIDGGGVCCYDKFHNNFIRFDIPKKNSNSKDNNRIWALVPDLKGNIWVGSYGDGLSMIDSETGEVIPINLPGLEGNKSSLLLQDIFCDSSGILWIATDGAGVIRYDPKAKQAKAFLNETNNPFTLSHNYISKIRDGGNGILWVTTYGRGISRFDIKTGKFTRFANNLIHSDRKSENEIWSSLYEPDGTLWLGYWGRGLAKYNTLKDEITFVGKPLDKGDLSSKIVLAIFRDRSGVLWVGTSEGGLNKITEGKVEEIVVKSAFGKELKVSTFHSLQNGKILTGTDNGLYLFDRNMIVEREINVELEENNITTIAKYRDNFWIGSLGGGIVVIDENFNVIEKYRRGTTGRTLSSDDITKIFVTQDSTLWIGTFGEGLNKFEPLTGTFTKFRFSGQSTIPQDHDKITDIRETYNHKLIVSTFSYGPCIFDELTGKFTDIKPADKNASQLPFKIIYSMIIDKTDIAWCATLGGILRVNIKNYTSESVPLSLSGNSLSIFSLTEADDEHLYLTSANTVFRFDKKNYSLMPLNSLKNSSHKNFISGSALRMADKLLFGTDKGFIFLSPKEFTKSRKLPQITIADVLVNDLSSNFREFFYNDEEFVLSGDDKRLQIVLAMFDFQGSSPFTLKYKLEGWDDKWLQVEPGVPIVYSNLSSGSYKFCYFVEGLDGARKEGRVLLIEVEPPFYFAWWFLVISISSVLSVVLFIANTRIRGIKKQRDLQREYSNLLIDSQEAERKRIASELHDSIGQDLAVIKNLAVMQTQKSNLQKGNEQLDLLIEVCTEAIEDVRKIAYDLRPYQIGKIGLTKAIEHLLELSKKAIPAEFDSTVENIDNLLDEKGELHIYRILQECLNNTSKYADATTISLKIIKRTNHFILEYSDNGSGFEMSKERF